jgi:molybdopterin/thiamine biosynthesis adenylyltransferase
MLSLDEIDRYSRQLVVSGWGAEGQEKIRAARVAVAGSGEAAEAAILYLAAAGVSSLTVEKFAEEARALNPLVEVCESPALATPEHSAVATILSPKLRIVGHEERAAVGAAVAVETLKAIIGIPYLAKVSLTV